MCFAFCLFNTNAANMYTGNKHTQNMVHGQSTRSKRMNARRMGGKGKTRRLGIGGRRIKFNNNMALVTQMPSAKKFRKTPRFTHAQPNATGAKVYGKIYAKWCTVCMGLVDEWNKAKLLIKVEEFSIEDIDMDKKMVEFKNRYKVSLPAVDGFPTIYKLNQDNQIEIYSGPREHTEIAKWVNQ